MTDGNLGGSVAFTLAVSRGLVPWNQGAWGKKTLDGVKWEVYGEGIMVASEG